MRKILTLLIVLTFGIAVWAQKYKLELNLKKGSTYIQTIVSKSTMTQTSNGKTTNADYSTTGRTSYKVIAINDSIYDLEARYESLSLNTKASSGNSFMVFSSEKKDKNDMLSSALSEATNKPFEVKMSKRGKVVYIQNMDSLLWTSLDELTFDMADEKQHMKAEIKRVFGDKILKNNLEQSSAIFPDHSVSIGDKWTTDITLNTGITAKSKTTYELKGIEGNCYVISGNIKMNSENKDEYKELYGMQIKMDASSLISSTTKVDKKTGWIKEQIMNCDMTSSSKIKESPQLPNGMITDIKMNMEMIITDK
jgi:hypothetical protein